MIFSHLLCGCGHVLAAAANDSAVRQSLAEVVVASRVVDVMMCDERGCELTRADTDGSGGGQSLGCIARVDKGGLLRGSVYEQVGVVI